MAIATATDVQNRLGRIFTEFETARVDALLEDIEVEIRRLAPDRITDPQWRSAVISVECSVAIRVSRIANAMSSDVPQTESIGYPSNPSYQKIELYRSDRRTLGLELTGSVQLAPVSKTDDFITDVTDPRYCGGWAWPGDPGYGYWW